MKSLHVLRYGEIMRRDFVVLILIFSMHLEGALRALVGFRQVSMPCWSHGGFLLDFVDVLFVDLSCKFSQSPIELVLASLVLRLLLVLLAP